MVFFSASVLGALHSSSETEEDISSIKFFMMLICKQSFVVIGSIINDYD
jgi:hypothetical protein